MYRFRREGGAIGTDTLLAAGWYALCSVASFGATAAALVLRSALGGSVHSVVFLPGATPLQVAGALVPVPIAYVGLGMARIYLTLLPAALLLAGAIGGALVDRGGTAVAAACGIAAAATATVVLGCPCGSGTAAALGLKAL